MLKIKYFVTENKAHTLTYFGAVLEGAFTFFMYNSDEVNELNIPDVVRVLQEKVIKQYLLGFVDNSSEERYYHACCIIATRLATAEIVQWTAMDDVKNEQHFRKNLKKLCVTE